MDSRIQMKSLEKLYIEQEKINRNIIRLTETIQNLKERQDDVNIKRRINKMKSQKESFHILLEIIRKNISRRIC